ncbi:double-strand break repair helicase AddA [Mesorhizobium sp. BAC0120]|uniref:double-strand break repair helicase AddA n=1 Tax=Mesorhizobium sp. BAC0120 TaxID=3090670 RepID=UPI00298CB4CF|nr:double-strand break repair helicase AddA [Mesorhizobium sp. BAC0120]MDW6024528.1 double-strand break repair helicase AddA [Mesorhizobium sp. BAC0120]
MKEDWRIPPETIERQAIAADPQNSVWVSANAGAGKTHVLSRRVIRLLLQGAEPSKILCLTYTRAAAANMAKRVYDDLAKWTALSHEALTAEVEALEGARPDAQKLARARRLFAEALETPGGLKIQTIHAFCEAILHQFPLEANIAGHFEMLDPEMEQALISEARRAMITGAGVSGQPTLASAFSEILSHGGEYGLDILLGEIVAKRDELRLFIEQLREEEGAFPALFEEFGFRPGETADSIAASVWPLPGFDQAGFEEFVHAAHAEEAKAIIANILPDAISAFAESDPRQRLRLLAKAFLNGDGEPYSPKLFKQPLQKRIPDLMDRYAAAVAAIQAAADRLALFRMLEATSAALIVADWLIARYEGMKAARGFLDFNDLITRTVRLLSRSDVGPWVQYKLDQGIDHILIDEAQDTSPEQWKVVRQLAEEFFSGVSARDNVHRTIFAVGDEKQSIYSFQGADPALFAESGHFFRERVSAAKGSFEAVKLNWSFRSTDDILSAVDQVFANGPARKGLTRDPEPIEHKAIRAGAPGYVEVWPSIGATAIEEPEDWREAIDHAEAPAVRLADAISRTIAEWIGKGEIIEGKGRRLDAGDVLVLVRKRDRFIHALSRRLKDLRIAVTGADRLSLAGHIAVKDLAALGRIALQPHDDLSLAALLRSPVFGLSDKALFDIAHGRRDVSLDRALRRKAQTDLKLGAIVADLDRWANEAAFKPVFDFYAGVLGRDGVRRKLIARLGPEAGDIIDEFMSFCLAQEKVGTPGLEAFLATLESAAPEIKREMDQGRAEVRIMTSHAAKGLEAPVVFLVDNGARPFSEQHLPRLLPIQSARKLWNGKGFLWRAASDLASESSRAAAARIREAAEEEYRRLLYVGMTRAEDRLIVCGYHGKQQQNGATWHALVTAALAGSADAESLPDPVLGEGSCRYRYRVLKGDSTVRRRDSERPAKRVPAPVPAWLTEQVAPEPLLPRPLTPSRAIAAIDQSIEPAAIPKSPVLDAGEEPSLAIARGLAVHKLLQVLPETSEAERDFAARRYIERIGRLWPAEDREAAAGSVMRIFADEAFAPIFSARSRAEVSIAGTLEIGGAERAISGKIDRLAITADEVLIVDYKTNRPPPERLADVPPAYVAQLALYRALLGPLYPGRAVRAALLFTETPQLIAVPEHVMEDALARLAQA